MKPFVALFILATAVLFVAGCSKSTDHTHAPAGAHVHTAPHGGTLVELGEHAYTLELLRDPVAGKLTAWVLDGHAETFVRIKALTIELVAMPEGKFTPLSLKAVPNVLTSETVGDTSQFEVQSDALKSAGEVPGIVTVEIRGTKFEQISFVLP